jgi:hypothetical protein
MSGGGGTIGDCASSDKENDPKEAAAAAATGVPLGPAAVEAPTATSPQEGGRIHVFAVGRQRRQADVAKRESSDAPEAAELLSAGIHEDLPPLKRVLEKEALYQRGADHCHTYSYKVIKFQLKRRVSCLLHKTKHESRDVPRCGALSLLRKPLHYRGGILKNSFPRQIGFICDLVRACCVVSRPPPRTYRGL